MNRLKEIEARLAVIGEELTRDGADLDALEAEINALKEERASIEAAVEKRAALIADVEKNGRVLRMFPNQEQRGAEQTFDVDSPEYRAAWLKRMAHNPKTGEWRLGELTEVEQRAFTFTTATTPNAIPGGISLGIVDMIAKNYAILGDISPTTFSGVVEFVQATTVVSGAADETDENTAASDDLQVTFNKETMTGVEIKGSVKLSNKMRIQSMDGFETWLVNELSREMGEKMNEHVFDAIDDDILADNVEADLVALTDADVRALFGSLKGGQGSRVVYANNSTIWNTIAGVEDEMGRPKFVESTVNDDPAVQGRIYGTAVKLDETLADGVIYVGYPAVIKANTFEAPNVLSDVDVETREITYGGYALFEARLGDTRAFAKATVAAAAVS